MDRAGAAAMARAAKAPPDGRQAPRRPAMIAATAVAIAALAWLGWRQFGPHAPGRAPGLAPTAATTGVDARGAKGATGRPSAGAIAPESIAVLPFVDMSQAHDQEYFSDGLSEELLNQLAQVAGLRVIARTSSFSFKGKEVPVADIARILRVGHVLEGSVRKSGNTLRITAQLIRASDSSHLWSQTYDRDLTDVFKVQDEIAREVVAALKVKMLAGAVTDNTQHTRDPAAYEQYLLGKDAGRAGGRAAVEAALAAYQRAVALDPGYANAYAELAFQQGSMADFAETPAAREAAIAGSLASADKAIALAPELADGYASRGNVRHRMRWDWRGAQADLARAMALAPTDSRVLNNYGAVLFSLGRRDEGLAVLRKSVASDPLSDTAWNQLARHLHAAGRKAEAEKAFERALTLNPLQNWANFLLGNLLLSEGRVDAAIAHYEQAPDQFRTTGMAMAEFTRGNEAASRQALAKMEREYAIGFAFQIAQAYAWRGDMDRAFAWLDRSYALHDAGLVRLPYDPAMDPLRKDPRFAALVAKMGFPK
jgi:TolB-like protein/tetratricopeptide (TPR) repeat protein